MTENNKSTLFCFTDFLPANVENGYHKCFEDYKDMIRGLYWGKESCPTTGRLHNQGFIQLYSQNRWTKIQKWFKSKCTFKVCKGNVEQNEEYCSKDGFYTKLGKFITKGYRSDLHNIKEDIKNGATKYDIMENYTGDFVRYHSGIESMRGVIDKRKRQDIGFRMPEVHVRFGTGGTGKTKFIYDTHGYINCFKISRYDDLKFMFNGYDNEDVLILDDFKGSVPYTYLLQLLDGYPLDINVKNSVRYNFFTKIYITSNDKPHNWYAKFKWNLARRIKTCLEVSKGNISTLLTYEESDFDDELGYDSD